MNTTDNQITPELIARIEAAYAKYPFAQTAREEGDYPSGYRLMRHEDQLKALARMRKYDIGRQVFDVLPLCDGIVMVIDQPKNFRDTFDYFGGSAWGRRGAGTAIVMREWFTVKLLYLDTMALETANWSGGRLPKDLEKAEKKLAKYKKSKLESMAKRKANPDWPQEEPRLGSVII